MSSLDRAVSRLRSVVEFESTMRARAGEVTKVLESTSSLRMIREQERGAGELLRHEVEELLRYPPCHSRHHDLLETFHLGGGFENSIFVMTKFPEGETETDAQLIGVINAVRSSIRDCRMQPRLASDCKYHPMLWDNVELYLLGCSRGVALVEDRYRPELNPNVAMEWGWMRGMGKDVLFLIEERFDHERADWSGLTKKSFSWDDPATGIRPAILDWLSGGGDADGDGR